MGRFCQCPYRPYAASPIVPEQDSATDRWPLGDEETSYENNQAMRPLRPSL